MINSFAGFIAMQQIRSFLDEKFNAFFKSADNLKSDTEILAIL